MACEFRTQRRIEFAETDCAGIIHFSSYYRYMEEAEHAFLRSLGLSVHGTVLEDGTRVGFPRLNARCQFSGAVTFEDVLDIHLWISHKGRKTIEYSLVFSHEGREVARGSVVVIACRVLDGLVVESISIPERFDGVLEKAPYPALEFRSPERREGK